MEAVVVKIEAKNRQEGKNPRQLRALGALPITIYGKGVNLNLQLNAHEFKLAYQKDKNAQYEINVGDKKYSAAAKNVQQNYATGEILSVEFAVI